MLTAKPLTLEQAARRAGAWAWSEGQLYEVLGEWSRTSLEAGAKVYFDSVSQHHAWRSGLWKERLVGRLVQAQPGSWPEPSPGLLEPPSEVARAVLAALSRVEGDEARLGSYCRVVLARAAAGYRSWLRVCNPASDRPIVRALEMALADVLRDWQEGTELLVRLLDEAGGAGAGDEAVAKAAEASAELERLWVGQGFW